MQNQGEVRLVQTDVNTMNVYAVKSTGTYNCSVDNALPIFIKCENKLFLLR